MKGNYRYRKHLRLKNHDYSSNGFYFITICCRKFKPYFGEVIEDDMILNDFGRIADEQWQLLSERYPQIQNHIHQIMPNHMHGILEIHNGSKIQNNPISQIVGAYKSLTYKFCRELSKGVLDKIWQPNFYEHVIRNDEAFKKIHEYVETNPAQWDKDKYFMK